MFCLLMAACGACLLGFGGHGDSLPLHMWTRRCTLLAAMNSFATVATATKAALKWLGHRDQAFIYWDEPSREWAAQPPVGCRCMMEQAKRRCLGLRGGCY